MTQQQQKQQAGDFDPAQLEVDFAYCCLVEETPVIVVFSRQNDGQYYFDFVQQGPYIHGSLCEDQVRVLISYLEPTH
jgi:hypothetical protein